MINNKQKIKIFFLGTNGWYDTDTGNTICVLIDAPEAYIVLDAGGGIYKLDQYIKTEKPIYLFISHMHLDHIAGLHTLARFKFRQGIKIFVKKGLKRQLEAVINNRYSVAFKNLKINVKVNELVDSQSKSIPFLEAHLPLSHPVPCLGFRFHFGEKVISYIADTGECENAYRLAGGADLVISECAFKSGQKFDHWPHLNPTIAAKIARDSGAKKLALIHFDAAVYQTLAERTAARNESRRIFANVIATRDGQRINL